MHAASPHPRHHAHLHVRCSFLQAMEFRADHGEATEHCRIAHAQWTAGRDHSSRSYASIVGDRHQPEDKDSTSLPTFQVQENGKLPEEDESRVGPAEGRPVR